MSARRKKRTNKANSEGVRSLQAREGETDLQAQPESMLQPPSEVVAGADTTNREEKQGGNKMQSFRDRIQSFGDRLELDKPSLIKMGMAVGISVCIMLIVFFAQGIPRGEYNASMTRMEQVSPLWAHR